MGLHGIKGIGSVPEVELAYECVKNKEEEIGSNRFAGNSFTIIFLQKVEPEGCSNSKGISCGCIKSTQRYLLENEKIRKNTLYADKRG